MYKIVNELPLVRGTMPTNCWKQDFGKVQVRTSRREMIDFGRKAISQLLLRLSSYLVLLQPASLDI